MKAHIKKFETIREALESKNNFSPNVTYIRECTNPGHLVLTNFGKDIEIEFVDNGGGYVTAKKAPQPLCFTTEQAGSTLKIITEGQPRSISLQYSTDKKTWNTYNIGQTITLQNVGDKVYFKGDNYNGISNDYDNYYWFNMSGKIAADGTITSLIDSTCKRTDIPCSYCYFHMFFNCASLTSAPELPATTLALGCYQDMLRGTSLISAPELPATTLATYCYYCMFQDCKKLVNTPKLPASTLAESCYDNMFNGCTSLTTSPELPAMSLVHACYVGMFQNCTSLTKTPKLPATTLATYCYAYMFQNCRNLSRVDIAATNTSAMSCLEYWLNNVASYGDFYSDPSTPFSTGSWGIPSNWTRHPYES